MFELVPMIGRVLVSLNASWKLAGHTGGAGLAKLSRVKTTMNKVKIT